MVKACLSRRYLLASIGAIGLLPNASLATDFIDLNWKDLLPEGQVALPPTLQGLLDHDESALRSRQPASSGVRSEWNGQVVRLPGFIVPIEYSGTGITAFILVPFVGACVHVPPPPANQLVFVTTSIPYVSSGLFESINVIGRINVSTLSTEFAQTGYALSAERIEPYGA